MESNEKSNVTGECFDSISPSAKALLLLKGITDIPYARQAAKIISLPEQYSPDLNIKDFTYWARVIHFEMRYRTVDQLLSDLSIANILELSSGFSFRGLQEVQTRNVHYIDTDLEELITTKKEFVSTLSKDKTETMGQLQVLPLNALNEQQFKETVKLFAPGALAIVNEGLLMYLDMEEKKKLCGIIYDILKERGGYWITADIYTKTNQILASFKIDDKLEHFFEQHKIEQNKFDSFEAAKVFFEQQGFILDKEAEPNYQNLNSFEYFKKSLTEEQASKIGKIDKMHATWRLKLA